METTKIKFEPVYFGCKQFSCTCGCKEFLVRKNGVFWCSDCRAKWYAEPKSKESKDGSD